jgi:hypothetical protein
VVGEGAFVVVVADALVGGGDVAVPTVTTVQVPPSLVRF